MERSEIEQLLAELNQGRRDLLESLAGVSEAAAVRSPGPGRWSVLEIVEHVAVVEDRLFATILASRAVDAPVVNEKRERLIPVRGRNRSFHLEAPEMVRPAGRYATLAAATEAFLTARRRTLRYVEDCHHDLRARMTTHPLLGTVNCWENLLMMAMHPGRHAAQIREALLAIEADHPDAQAHRDQQKG